MAAILVPVIIIVIALVAGAITASRFVRRERVHANALRRGREDTLRYQVPHGQDPAAVVLGLTRAGYDAVPDPTVGQTNELLIAGQTEPTDRESVRRALAGITQLNLEGDELASVPPVRFMDE